MPFWVHLVVLLAIASNIAWLFVLVIPKIRGWLAHHRHLRTKALLRRSPTALMGVIRERERTIEHLEDKVLSLKAELDRAEMREGDLQKEVRTLCQRNVMMANEVRCDHTAETQVLRPKWTARF